ncbi:hypothetical protein [Actinoplanes sp. NPDC026619]|uniref:hypothetical protein n=1 Tax=Actinoplanes sp. NPDC026619 TaxID=3155798 RepID=UPI0033CA6CCB
MAGFEIAAIEAVAWIGTAITSALAGTSLAGSILFRRKRQQRAGEEQGEQPPAALDEQQIIELRTRVIESARSMGISEDRAEALGEAVLRSAEQQRADPDAT